MAGTSPCCQLPAGLALTGVQVPHACTNLRRLDDGLCGLQIYLRAHGALWTNSKAWCRAMLALVLGDWGAQVRFLTLLAGMLPSSEGQELDSLGDEEVFLATYLEGCYNVGSLCTSQTSTACSSSAFGRMLQVEVSPTPPFDNGRLVLAEACTSLAAAAAAAARLHLEQALLGGVQSVCPRADCRIMAQRLVWPPPMCQTSCFI